MTKHAQNPHPTAPSEADIRRLGPSMLARLALAEAEDMELEYGRTEPFSGLIGAIRGLAYAVIEMESRYPEGFHRG
jgi:hypothetical protein